MGVLARSSTSVIDVFDGNGIASSIIDYAVSSSGTQPPGNPITDGEGNPILDNNGEPLTDGEWTTDLPTVDDGLYLWTRTRLIYTDGTFDIIYTLSQHGSTGATGATITNQKEQYYLSSSPTQLTGGTWGYEEPNPIPTGKYLWGRFENIMSDGTVTYSTAVHRSTISGVINLTNEIDGKITQKIWQSDIDSTIEDYDNPTGTNSLRDRVTQTESDISGITQTVGQVQSTLTTKADGSTVTTLQNDYSEFKQTMGGFKTTVESSYAQLTDVDNKIADIKVGGNNLYVIADEIPGYVTGTGVISAQDPTNKEVTSAYIPVQEGEDYIIQSWATPNTTGQSWLAYQFYANTNGTTVGSRQAKYGKDSNSGVTITAEGQEHLSYTVKVPQNANYLRVSYRKFNDGYAMVEKATLPSEYSINPKDIEKYTDDAVTTAKSEIKQTTDNISLEVSKKVGASEIISKINQSPENITISASKVDLVGQVTFSMLDSSTQNTISNASDNASTASSNASDALAAANQANTNASNAVDAVNNSIKSTTMHYLATSASSGVTRSTSGWTTTIQSIDATKRYLWTYQTITKVNNTTTDTDPVISGVWGNTGGQGNPGISVTKVEQLYRTSNSTTAPAAPTSLVTSTSTTYNTWTLAMPEYNASYPYYYTCTQTTYSSGNPTWTTPSRCKAIEDANTTANTANTNASSAVSTANTANTNASSAVSTANSANTTANAANTTANTANTTANNAIKGLKAYVGTSSTAAGTATKVVDCTDTDFQLINGVTITITFSTANTADALKLNVKSTGEKAVYYDTAVTSQNNRFRWQANSVITFQYDGTNWVVLRYETREYFACSTAESTSSKATNSATGSFILCKGTTVNVYFSKANTANATTLNVGATGAFSICYKNAVTSASNQYFWDAGTTLTFTYNGSYWYVSDNGTQLVKNYAKTAVDWVGTNGSSVVTAKDIVNSWKGEAENNVTTINGGLIQSHTILAKNLATDAIMSNNYSTGVQNQNIPVYNSATNPYLYSNTGTFLDLASGNIYSPNFTLINQTPANTNTHVGTYLNGTITATAGRIGEAESSYWEIGTTFDDSWNDTAAIIAHGSAAIETGTLTLSNARLNSLNSGDYVQYGTGNDAKWYDYGLQVPNLAATGQDTYYNDFLFIRYINTKPDEGTLNSDWNYLFRVDKDGFIYENGQPLSSRYAAIGDVEGAYVSTTGGTVNGNLTVTGTLTATASAASKLSAARNLNVNLATTSNDGKVAFDGSANVTLGITGTLGVAHGGTGATTFASGQVLIGNNAGAITTREIKNNTSQGPLGWTSSTVDNTLITTNTLAYWDGRYQATNNASNIQYVRLGKIGTVVTHDVEEFITSSGGTVNGALTVTDLAAGNLVVNGGATFTNGLTGDLTGNVVGIATYATKVKDSGNNTDTTFAYSKSGLAANWTTNPWFAAWSGYELRAISPANLKTTIGLGNVENTADADKNVLSAAQFTEAQTITLTGDTTGSVSSQAGWSISTTTKSMSTFGNINGTDHAAALKTYFDANNVNTTRNKPISFWSNVSNNGSIAIGYFLQGYSSSPYGGFFVAHYNNAYYVGINNGTYTQQKIVTSTNYTDYTVTKTGGGASGDNWGISITGNAATATSATQADHVANSLTIQLNGGSTEGTNKFTYNGSAGKSFNITKSSIGLGNVTNNAQVKGLSSGTTSGHLVTWGSDGYTVADSGITKGNIVKSVASDSDGKLVLTYADDTTSDPIAVQFVASSASSVNIANSLNVGGTAVGSTSLPVYFTNQGKPAVITSLPKSYVGLGNVDNTADANKNVLSATKFTSAQSITLTGDTTGTASSQAGWSIATTTKYIHSLGRIASADIQIKDNLTNKISYSLSSGSMTTSKPPAGDGYILTFGWDNNGWGSQLFIKHTTEPCAMIRGASSVNVDGNNGLSQWGDWYYLLDSHNFNTYAPKKDGTGATGDWDININGNAATATKLTGYAGSWATPVYIDNGVPTAISYLGIHPEDPNSALLPFISNDLAWLVKQGGSYEIYSTTSTSFTAASINKTTLNLDLTPAFDGTYSYAYLNRPQTETTVIDIVCPYLFAWTTKFYIDFGTSAFRAKNIVFLVCNSSTETSYVQKGSITNNALGRWMVKFSHSSVNSEGTTAQGFDRIRIVLSDWANATYSRIAQIGLVSYNSDGIRKSTMSRGYDDPVWRSITPATTNTYNLGSSTNKWGTVYATTFNGNATSATTATSATNATSITPTQLTNQNLNDIKTVLKTNYYYSGGNNNVSNNPMNSATTPDANTGLQFGMYTYATAGGHVAQELSGYGTTENHGKWIRWFAGTSWSSWEKFITSSGGTFTGAVSGTTFSGTSFSGTSFSGTSFSASSYIAANIGGTNNAGGLSLWGTNPLEYGIAMRGTGNGKFGYVQSSNWAVYFSVNGPDSDPAATRGWIFRNHQTNSAVASISGGGNITTGGSVTVGGNTTNTSGCEMVFDAATNSLNFTFK